MAVHNLLESEGQGGGGWGSVCVWGGRGSSIDRNNQKENYSTLTVIIIIVTYEIRSCFKKFISGPAQVHVCTKQINKLKDMQQQKKRKSIDTYFVSGIF